MRLVLKLSAVVLLGVLAQCAIVRFVGELDEAIFVARVMVAQVQGRDNHDAMIMDHALRLYERQCKRAGYVAPSTLRVNEAACPPVASAADEI